MADHEESIKRLVPMQFVPNLKTLPAAQRILWPELHATPMLFTLYGGTALALRLGHRTSVDFDFFTNATFDAADLLRNVPYLKDAEPIQIAPNTLTCRITRGEPVLVSYYGNLNLRQIQAPENAADNSILVASLLDIAGTKASVVSRHAETKDYLDIDALLQHGLNLSTILAAGKIVYGAKFNPLITLKALSYFDDVPTLASNVQTRLRNAVRTVDLTCLPKLTVYRDSDG